MALHRRSPRPLAEALAPLQQAMTPETLIAEVQAAWASVVGPVIAGEAQAVSERAGTLTVHCAAAVWAQELELMPADILERLNRRLTRGRISTLRCVTT